MKYILCLGMFDSETMETAKIFNTIKEAENWIESEYECWAWENAELYKITDKAEIKTTKVKITFPE